MKNIQMYHLPETIFDTKRDNARHSNRKSARQKTVIAAELARYWLAFGATRYRVTVKLNELGVTSSRGGVWSESTVNRMLDIHGITVPTDSDKIRLAKRP